MSKPVWTYTRWALRIFCLIFLLYMIFVVLKDMQRKESHPEEDAPVSYGENVQKTTALLDKLRNDIFKYYWQSKSYPDPKEWRQVLNLKDEDSRDQWGTPLEYMKLYGKFKGFILRSAGPDRKFDTIDDLKTEIRFIREDNKLNDQADSPVKN